ncbi:Protein of unknown function (DUF3570) [Aequorivita sublithincola DSM 14238]|uniref:DUF3570 domain-containing protein n=1 Tax=Aequorivita sublithincola (strain DSM 14238 / LMG 21431 / ACAM 643 / 9-3) TaxID=746697 RepID=I3YT29_AEQSU|nr:DUF3570 domain-containing protein [Aequorivita sublithincola]AFL80147.1 Protein of unknown function (DUF3570) [Aequorivita sublithincola DSM 14238]
MKNIISLFVILFSATVFAQDSTSTYKKRVLEAPEVDFLASYYSQDGDNAAVSGGIGTEKLTDITPTIVVAIPVNDDDVLKIDAGISAYTSASSSNIDPFDSGNPADPFVASSGASSSDIWFGGNLNYSHSSDSRNDIISAKVSVSSEYDYFSIGFGGTYTKLFNEKNTEVSIHANAYLDTWKLLYPIELRESSTFNGLDKKNRNSYSLGFGFAQILSKSIQTSFSLDLVQQQGLLSTPFQRVYFSDLPDRFRENFQLADDVERLPDTRFKTAIGGRLNYFINEIFVVRIYYRYYFDNWGITSQTANVEIPIKITDKFTLYPSYRFYNQTAADYFYPYNIALSTSEFYTSDYDLSKFSANQYGFGVSYTDIFTKLKLMNFGLKSVDLKYDYYKRDSGLYYSLISVGIKFIGN